MLSLHNSLHHLITAGVHHISFFFLFTSSMSNYSSFHYTLSDIFLPPPLIFSLLCLSIIYINNFLILQSRHCILSLLYLNFFRTEPTYLTKGYARSIIFQTFFTNFHILHLDHLFIYIIVFLKSNILMLDFNLRYLSYQARCSILFFDLNPVWDSNRNHPLLS